MNPTSGAPQFPVRQHLRFQDHTEFITEDSPNSSDAPWEVDFNGSSIPSTSFEGAGSPANLRVSMDRGVDLPPASPPPTIPTHQRPATPFHFPQAGHASTSSRQLPHRPSHPATLPQSTEQVLSPSKAMFEWSLGSPSSRDGSLVSLDIASDASLEQFQATMETLVGAGELSRLVPELGAPSLLLFLDERRFIRVNGEHGADVTVKDVLVRLKKWALEYLSNEDLKACSMAERRRLYEVVSGRSAQGLPPLTFHNLGHLLGNVSVYDGITELQTDDGSVACRVHFRK